LNKNKIYHFFKSNWEFTVCSLGLFLLVILSLDHIFFWDTVQLASKHATFYYENDLRLALLPNEIDSGHIPTFGYMLAILWTLFGKSLWISHLFILPFAVGIVWQLNKIVKHYFAKQYHLWILLIILLDTTFLSQVSLVSPDIPLLFFFLTGLNSIIFSKPILKTIAFTCLFLISLRGMILTVPLFLFDVVFFTNFKTDFKGKVVALFKTGIPYVPSALVFVVFSWFHYQQKGWIGYHENSPWAVFFQRVDIQGMIKNVGVFGWRLLDYGRIGIWLIGFLLIPVLWKKRNSFNSNTKQLFGLAVFILLFLSIPAIIYFDLKGHRYFMPIYFSSSLFIGYVLFQLVDNKAVIRAAKFFILLCLLSGSFWVYPDKIAQGWDSTLGHFPYYQLRENMIQYLEENNIDKSKVGFDFPGAYPQKYLDLSSETWSFPEVDFTSQQFVLYSNVVNEFTDNELKLLTEDWTLVHSETSSTVKIMLYENPHY